MSGETTSLGGNIGTPQGFELAMAGFTSKERRRLIHAALPLRQNPMHLTAATDIKSATRPPGTNLPPWCWAPCSSIVCSVHHRYNPGAPAKIHRRQEIMKDDVVNLDQRAFSERA